MLITQVITVVTVQYEVFEFGDLDARGHTVPREA